MSEKYNYIIIDDDDFARETLEELLREIPQIKLLKSLSDSAMAIKHLATLKPDLVFLDVNMPKKTGIDIQKEIIQLNLKTKVIFTTAHEEFVLEAFKNQAFDYLVKPVKKSELHETLFRFFKDEHNSDSNEVQSASSEIVFKNAIGSLVLKKEDIIYVEADGSYTKIYLINGDKEILSKNIGKVEALFNTAPFFKISRSHIINLKYLKKTDRLNKKVLLIVDNKTFHLKVSRERFYDLEQKI